MKRSKEEIDGMKVDIPDELIGLVEKIILSNKFDWLQYENVQDFVVDAVKRRIDELIWGASYERRQS